MHTARPRRRRAIFTALGTVAAIGLASFAAGCGDDDSDTDDRAAPAAPASFEIVAASEGRNKPTLTFPSTVKAGLVTMTLNNTDTKPRSAGLIRLVGDHTVDDVIKVTSSGEEGAPIPTWLEDGGGVGAVEPGKAGSVTQVLVPGRYAITDDETEGGMGEGKTNAQRGAKGEFTVTGPAVDAELPARPATITATDDGKDEYGFEFEGLEAGTNEIRWENTGKELHHAIFIPILEGRTFAEAKKAFTADEPPKGPPPVDFEKIVGTQVIDGGIAQNMTLDLAPGNYAVVCFINDRKGGKPHVNQGMIEEFTIE